MKEFQGYRQKKNNDYAQQKPQRLELRNGKETLTLDPSQGKTSWSLEEVALTAVQYLHKNRV